jgi:hypothetical protein
VSDGASLPRQVRKAIWLCDIADIFANVHDPLSGIYTGDVGAAMRENQLPVCTANFLQTAFSYKVFCAAFLCLQFGYVIFWQKGFSANAAHKMLAKLTLGGSIGPGHILQLLFSENQKIANNSATTEAT